jgi:hypothetical protein
VTPSALGRSCRCPVLIERRLIERRLIERDLIERDLIGRDPFTESVADGVRPVGSVRLWPRRCWSWRWPRRFRSTPAPTITILAAPRIRLASLRTCCTRLGWLSIG